MIPIKVNKALFKFKYIPEYAEFILHQKLEEFVLVAIRFSREANLPLLQPLAKYSEAELAAMSTESNRQLLKALVENRVGDFVEESLQKWVDNTLELVDQHDITSEDLILTFSLRRKIFAFFLDAYTKNLVEQKFIIAELDTYTTGEEMLSLNIFLALQ